MKIKVNSSFWYSFLYYFAYSFFLLYSFIGHSAILHQALMYGTYIAIIIFLFLIILQFRQFKRAEIMTCGMLLLVSIIMFYKTGNSLMIKTVIFLMAARNTDVKKCIKYDCFLRLILIPLTIVLSLEGIVPNVIRYVEGGVKLSLGFTHPNVFGMHTFIFLLEVLYLGYKRLSIYKMLIVVGVVYVLNIFAGSRTVIIATIFTMTVFSLYQVIPKILEKKVVSWGIKNSALLLSVVTFVFFILYRNDFELFAELNELLSNRLYNIMRYSEFYNINIFGNDITLINLTMDTVFVYVLYGLGVMGGGLLLYSFKKLFVKLYHLRDYKMIIIFLIFLTYGLSERLWLSIDYNIWMLVFSIVLFKDKQLFSTS